MAAILALNTREDEILTDEMLDDIFTAAGDAYEVAWLKDLPEERWEDIEIAFGAISYRKTTFMPRLKWLQLTSAGVDHANNRRKYLHPNFRLTNANGAYGEQIAEHVLAFFLGFGRGLHAYRDNQHKQLWEYSFPARKMKGSTVGIIGLGDIGLATAKLCSAMGANVLAVKRSFCKKPPFISELSFDLEISLDDVLRRADYVALCLPLTESTQHIMDARRMDMLREGCVLVNIGRGALIDQQALIARLEKGDIYAGLDVTTPEPLEADSPLWRLPNCWITPHMSGLAATAMPYICGLFVDNLRRYMDGAHLRNVVDFGEGY